MTLEFGDVASHVQEDEQEYSRSWASSLDDKEVTWFLNLLPQRIEDLKLFIPIMEKVARDIPLSEEEESLRAGIRAYLKAEGCNYFGPKSMTALLVGQQYDLQALLLEHRTRIAVSEALTVSSVQEQSPAEDAPRVDAGSSRV